jgi:hypothetical protein
MSSNNLDIANSLLTEASLVDFKRKMGGNASAGNENLKIGERYVQRISLMRELDIEIAHFKGIVESAGKLLPVDQNALKELRKALKSIEIARESLSKSVKEFSVVMTDKTVK